MSPSLSNALLAADFEGIGVVIFIIIGIISWIVKLVGQQNQVPPPAPRQPGVPPRPANPNLSREIDVFLQEISGRKKPEEPVEIEVVPDSELRRRPARQPVRQTPQPPRRPLQRQQRQAAQQPARQKSQPPRVRPGQEIAERHNIDPSKLGTTLQDHVSQYMGSDRIDQEVQQRLARDVERSVERHLGQFGASSTAADVEMPAINRNETANEIVKMLRNRVGVRQAVLINEVLGKPIGLRKR